MKTYRILKDGQTKLVVPGRVLADGTLRCTDQETPIVLSAECLARGLDPKAVQKAAAPAECLGRLGANAGGIEIVEEEAYQAALSAKRVAAMTPAEKAWNAEVLPVICERDAAYARRDHNYHGYLATRQRAAHAVDVWAAQYPEAATARREKTAAENAAHEAEIRSRPGYIAAMEGRD